jgi:hypothetical protein
MMMMTSQNYRTTPTLWQALKTIPWAIAFSYKYRKELAARKRYNKAHGIVSFECMSCGSRYHNFVWGETKECSWCKADGKEWFRIL